MATAKKKTASKQTPARKTTKRASAGKQMRSFEKSDTSPPFMSYTVTKQTVYWFVVGALILALGLWVTLLQMKIQRIYDQAERNNNSNSVYVKEEKKSDKGANY